VHPHSTAPDTQYADDRHLRARQAFWARVEPDVDLISWALDLAGLAGDEAVVDAGCGNGVYLAGLAGRHHRGRLVGLDLSPGMLQSVTTPVPRVTGDVQALPFPAGAFDVALAPHVLHHVPDRQVAAAELRRVVRPGGRCIVVTNGAGNLARMCALVEGAAGGGWRWQRPAETVFGLENGAAQLGTAFDEVERVDMPPRQVVITDPEVVVAYLASVRDHYEDQLPPGRWDAVLAAAGRWAAGAIGAQGELRMATSMGAFVCR
jgi:SAM-dependent methyltransferase